MSQSKQAFIEEARRKLDGDSDVERPTAMVVMIIGRDGEVLQADMTCWGSSRQIATVMRSAVIAAEAMADGHDDGVLVRTERPS